MMRAKRHVGLGAPTGIGKSLIAYLLAKLGGRTVILTSRKGLADQYGDAFPDIVDIRGHDNYLGDTAYHKQVERAEEASIVITNYAYWLATARAPRIGKFDLLVLDEAHGVFDELSNHMSLTLSPVKLANFNISWPDKLGDGVAAWSHWAVGTGLPRLERVPKGTLSKVESDRYDALHRELQVLSHPKGDWVVEREQDGRQAFARISKVWPTDEAEAMLFQGIGHVLWMSATLRPKAFTVMGVDMADVAFKEFPHPFDPAIRPVVWVPTAKMTPERGDMGEAITNWTTRLDQLIGRAPDALGLIHTVSYRRAQDFLARSRHNQSGILCTHDSSTTAEQVEWFLQQAPPRVMVSPVLIAGWDLGGVKWQCIGKLPYPNSSDPLSMARKKIDPDLIPFKVAQDIVQTAGRIVRGPDWSDAGETWVIDDAIGWFLAQYSEFVPRWFKVQKVSYVDASKRLWDRTS
jgi:Rad3-related DNA helicase